MAESDVVIDYTSVSLEIYLENGLCIKKDFAFPSSEFGNCIIHGEQLQYAVELTHQCQSRRLVYEELNRLLPMLVHKDDLYWFRTLNKDQAPNDACLFPGALLQMNLLSKKPVEFGFCFSRSAFIMEREHCDYGRATLEAHVLDDSGRSRRKPSDHERLLVNREGWEILYLIHLPDGSDLNYTELRAEICEMLRIVDKRRVSFASGPFSWGPDFKEDGLGIYRTYFSKDIVIGSRHMKTTRGAALIEVVENNPLFP